MNLKDIFCLIFLVEFFRFEPVKAGVQSTPRDDPMICQPAPFWSKDGRDLMHEHLGNVTLVALMELQCTFCRNQINSLERLLDYVKNHSLEPTKIIIIAPMNESSVFVEYHQQILHGKGISVIQESRLEPIWEPLKGFNNDFFLYDTCGRLNFYIPYPQSFTYYHYTVNTVYSVHKHQKCGPCSAYPPRRTYPQQHPLTYDPSSFTPKHMKAWVESVPAEHHHVPAQNHHVPGQHHNVPGQRHHHESADRLAGSVTLAPTEIHIEAQTYRSIVNETTSKKIGAAHKIRHDKHKKGKGKKKVKVSTTTMSTTDVPSTTHIVHPEHPVDENSDYIIYDPDGHDEFTSTIEPSQDTATAQLVPAESTTQQFNETDHDDSYEDEINVSQIGSDSVVPEAVSPTTTTTTTTTTRKPIITGTRKPRSSTTRRPRVHKPKGDLGGCSSFSDISCFDLQENGKELDSCCYKGVYLTGVCNRDLCTSKTYHLCCFQKYQQARYQCCHNDTMPFDRPDDFSKCCYNIFVEDDPCCPTSVAHSFWSHKTRITELCLPSIDIIYNGVTLEAEMKDKSKVKLELGKFKSLQYQCPAANKRNDFFYWEPDAPPKMEVADVKATTL